MRRTAVKVAVVGLLGLATVGACCGLPPYVCATRALAGAVILYVLATVAGRVTIRLIVDSLFAPTDDRKDDSRERAN